MSTVIFWQFLFIILQPNDDTLIQVEADSTHIICNGEESVRAKIRDTLLKCLHKIWYTKIRDTLLKCLYKIWHRTPIGANKDQGHVVEVLTQNMTYKDQRHIVKVLIQNMTYKDRGHLVKVLTQNMTLNANWSGQRPGTHCWSAYTKYDVLQ